MVSFENIQATTFAQLVRFHQAYADGKEKLASTQSRLKSLRNTQENPETISKHDARLRALVLRLEFFLHGLKTILENFERDLGVEISSHQAWIETYELGIDPSLQVDHAISKSHAALAEFRPVEPAELDCTNFDDAESLAALANTRERYLRDFLKAISDAELQCLTEANFGHYVASPAEERLFKWRQCLAIHIEEHIRLIAPNGPFEKSELARRIVAENLEILQEHQSISSSFEQYATRKHNLDF